MSIMVKTVNLQLDVPVDRRIHFTLPPDVPTGFLEAVLVIVPPTPSPATAPPDPALPALDDLLHADFFGMWKDRTDIDDSAAFAQHLRTKAWSRPL